MSRAGNVNFYTFHNVEMASVNFYTFQCAVVFVTWRKWQTLIPKVTLLMRRQSTRKATTLVVAKCQKLFARINSPAAAFSKAIKEARGTRQ